MLLSPVICDDVSVANDKCSSNKTPSVEQPASTFSSSGASLSLSEDDLKVV